MSAKASSIHFEKVSTHAFKHNDRTDKPRYVIDTPERNACNTSSKLAKQRFDTYYDEAIDTLHERKIKRKPNKQNALWEAVVNLKPDHTMEDVEKLTKLIEAKTGFTALQMAIHKDEGRICDTDTDKTLDHESPGFKFDPETMYKRFNHHAHITFFTLDRQTGKQLYQREFMNRSILRELQDITAKELSMTRGKSAEESGTKRLGHREYKMAMRMKENGFDANDQEHKATVQEIETYRKEARQLLKDSGIAVQKDYSEVRQLFDVYRKQGATVQELRATVTHLQHDLQSQIRKKEEETQTLHETIKKQQTRDPRIMNIKFLVYELENRSDYPSLLELLIKGSLEPIRDILKEMNMPVRDVTDHENTMLELLKEYGIEDSYSLQKLKDDYGRFKTSLKSVQQEFVNLREKFNIDMRPEDKGTLRWLIRHIEHLANEADDLFQENEQLRKFKHQALEYGTHKVADKLPLPPQIKILIKLIDNENIGEAEELIRKLIKESKEKAAHAKMEAEAKRANNGENVDETLLSPKERYEYQMENIRKMEEKIQKDRESSETYNRRKRQR